MAPRRAKLDTIDELVYVNPFLHLFDDNPNFLPDISVSFADILPPIEVIQDYNDFANDLYCNTILESFNDITKDLIKDRETFKEVLKELDESVVLPKTPTRGKNVSVLAKYYENIEKRKENNKLRVNLFANNVSHVGQTTPTRGAVMGLKKTFTAKPVTPSRLYVPGMPTNRQPLDYSAKRERNTMERDSLRQQQTNQLDRADHNKQRILQEKTEKARREREERSLQVEERRKAKEAVLEAKRKAIQEREEETRRFQEEYNKTPKSQPRKPLGSAPRSTASKPRHRSPSPVIVRSYVDQSMDNSEIYKTPSLTKNKRKSTPKPNTLVRNCLFDSPLRKNPRPDNFKENEFGTFDMKNFEEEMRKSVNDNLFDSQLPDTDAPLFMDVSCSEYEMTRPIVAASTEDDYNIADLSENDGTDDEDNPRKEVPSWAKPENLRPALIAQHKKYGKVSDFSAIFGPNMPLDIAKIFKGYTNKNRNSSAVWTSPLNNPRTGKAAYHLLSDSILDSSIME
uniref:INCENP_ARK-bind domain-containing protein n=1 Tax=Rhabditophanes sp. KR3021 TaxID=114890 RepID=A0AC35TPQ6_9BILA